MNITSWQRDGEPMETVTDFLLGGRKITAYGDCGHEVKRCLLLGRKTMTNLDSKLKSRDITLPTKVHLVKAMVFPVFMYVCESWTIKKVYKESWTIKIVDLISFKICSINQNHNEVPSHAGQNGCYQKVYKQ